MELDEMLAFMATTIYAADARSRTGDYAEAARHAVAQADMIWRCILDRKQLNLPYYRGPVE